MLGSSEVEGGEGVVLALFDIMVIFPEGYENTTLSDGSAAPTLAAPPMDNNKCK
jgi:hypothetical protein